MAGEALYYGTGRRKNAVARVRLVPGTGKVTVNGRDGEEYFGREALLNYAKTPFKVTDTQGHFDVIANITGGPYGGAQEVRPEEGSQAPAVLQALVSRTRYQRRPARKSRPFLLQVLSG